MSEERLVRFVGLSEAQLQKILELDQAAVQLDRLEGEHRALIDSHVQLKRDFAELRRSFDELVAWAMSSDQPPLFTGTRLQQLEAALHLANQRIKGDPGERGPRGFPGQDGQPGPPGDAAATVIREVKISG